MLHMNRLMKFLSYRIPKPLLDSVDDDFFFDILLDMTLPTYSLYYPHIVRGIRVKETNAIKSFNPTIGREAIERYVIPNSEPEYEYIGVSTFFHHLNTLGSGLTTTMSTPVNSMYNNILSSVSDGGVNVTCKFEPPDIVRIEPAAVNHVDFTVNMKRVCKIEQVQASYVNDFMKLYEADIKVAMYNLFYNVREGGSYGGVELSSLVGDYGEFEDKRNEIIEIWEGDYWKNSDRYQEIFQST